MAEPASTETGATTTSGAASTGDAAFPQRAPVATLTPLNPPRRPASPVRDWEGIDLCEKAPLLRRILKWRPLHFWLIWPNLFIFALFLVAGLWGSPVGNRNMIIVWVWILWWFLLISALVPLVSRFWCTLCPLPALGEWAQRLRLTGVWAGKGPKKHRTRLFGLNRDWPAALRNIWLQNIGFLALAVFSALLVTRPIVTVLVLGSMIILAVAFSLVFRQRAFCMYLCPVSGFLSLYSMAATTAIRVKDPGVCKAHTEKDCVLGSAAGYGCPWFQYIGNMTRNNYCGMCFECFKTCPHDNVTVYLRRPFSDVKLSGYAEAWKAFIMIVLALVYSVTLLGPYGTVKDWANVSEVGDWAGFGIYAAVVIALPLVVFPALHFGAVALGRALARAGGTTASLKEQFIAYAYIWVPIGLFAWIAFSVPLIMVNGAYIISTLSDPLGRGWNLFGTANVAWRPLLPEWVGFLQVPLLLTGLYYGVSRTWKIATAGKVTPRGALLGLLPTWTFAGLVTIGFMRFFVG